jgi:hypothetical protein
MRVVGNDTKASVVVGCSGDSRAVDSGIAPGVAGGSVFVLAGIDAVAPISMAGVGRNGAVGEHAVNAIKMMTYRNRHRTVLLALAMS